MATRPAPSLSEVESAFAKAMQDAGFLPGPIRADTDKFIRFDAPGDKAGKGNGYYKLKTGAYPVGWFGDWKDPSNQHQWFFADPNASPLSEKERAAIKREQARLKAEAAQAREAKQAEVAEDASRKWKNASSDVEGHPYLKAKGIEHPRGLRVYTAKDGVKLLTVPMFAFDMNGEPQLVNLQLIDGDGRKTFLKAGRKEGTFFSVKGGKTSYIAICEGVSTGFSVWEATDLSVVIAFDSGNLIPVAKYFARHRPMATLVIAGDDDAIAPDDWAERMPGKQWVNAGRVKAEAAAKAVGCRFILPVFAEGPARGRTDFNDLYQLEGRRAVANQILGALESVSPEEAEPGARVIEFDRGADETWRAKIPVTSNGHPDGANVEGVRLYIGNHRLLSGRLRFNQLTREMELDGNPLEDHHVAEFRRIMHADRFKAKKGDVQDEVEAEARRNAFDPLLDYLTGLKWDGKPRLDRWLTTHLGAEANEYTRLVGRRFLIGAVARANAPAIGIKLDSMLVLEGPQGLGKSTAMRYLFGDRFFVDELPDFHSKDSFIQLQGAWCVEVAELSALTKADVKDVKKFLSRLVDKFRPPYGRNTVQVVRRTVFVGTVNPEHGGYLRDQTGNRRFWPVECTAIDLAAVLRDRDQLWAEAVHAYRQGERWHLVEDEIGLASVEQDKRREKHPWEAVIADWADRHIVRRTTCSAVLAECLKIPADKLIPKHSRDVGACLRALGWEEKVERYGDDGKVAKVFRHPSLIEAEEKWGEGAIPGARGPQDDVPF